MYNRYIPQPDGSHRRRMVNEPQPSQQTQHPQQPQPQITTAPPVVFEETPVSSPPPVFRAGDFLKRLIPKDLDTGDLLIIVLLLLMSGECKEEKNTALLTLALYLFM